MASNSNLISFDHEIRKKTRVSFFNTNFFSELNPNEEFIPNQICVKSTLLFGYYFYKTVFVSYNKV